MRLKIYKNLQKVSQSLYPMKQHFYQNKVSTQQVKHESSYVQKNSVILKKTKSDNATNQETVLAAILRHQNKNEFAQSIF